MYIFRWRNRAAGGVNPVQVPEEGGKHGAPEFPKSTLEKDEDRFADGEAPFVVASPDTTVCQPIQLNISRLSGEIVTVLDMHSEATGREIALALAQVFGRSWPSLRLFTEEGEELKITDTLEAFGLVNGATLHAIVTTSTIQPTLLACSDQIEGTNQGLTLRKRCSNFAFDLAHYTAVQSPCISTWTVDCVNDSNHAIGITASPEVLQSNYASPFNVGTSVLVWSSGLIYEIHEGRRTEGRLKNITTLAGLTFTYDASTACFSVGSLEGDVWTCTTVGGAHMQDFVWHPCAILNKPDEQITFTFEYE